MSDRPGSFVTGRAPLRTRLKLPSGCRMILMPSDERLSLAEPTVVVLDPKRKPMTPEQWEKVRRQVREIARRIKEHRAKKKQSPAKP